MADRREEGWMPSTGRNRRQSSFPFHWGLLYRKTTNTKAKSSSGPFPAIYFLKCRHRTNWCCREKTRSKQSSLIIIKGFRSCESLRQGNAIFSWPLSQCLIGANSLKESHLLSKQNVSLAHVKFAILACTISHALYIMRPCS